MNLKFFSVLACATFVSQSIACNTGTTFRDQTYLSTMFPVSKQMQNYDFNIPTTKQEMDSLHDLYVNSGKAKCCLSDIWYGVGKTVYLNALEGVMTFNKSKIVNSATSYGKFVRLAKSVDYGDGFCDTLLEQPQTLSRSISDPILTLSATIACDLYTAKFNYTVGYVKQNGGYMAIKLYDTILQNNGLYDRLLSHYEEVTSSFSTPEIDVEDLVKFLLN